MSAKISRAQNASGQQRRLEDLLQGPQIQGSGPVPHGSAALPFLHSSYLEKTVRYLSKSQLSAWPRYSPAVASS